MLASLESFTISRNIGITLRMHPNLTLCNHLSVLCLPFSAQQDTQSSIFILHFIRICIFVLYGVVVFIFDQYFRFVGTILASCS